jgi:hypothetical protein
VANDLEKSENRVAFYGENYEKFFILKNINTIETFVEFGDDFVSKIQNGGGTFVKIQIITPDYGKTLKNYLFEDSQNNKIVSNYVNTNIDFSLEMLRQIILLMKNYFKNIPFELLDHVNDFSENNIIVNDDDKRQLNIFINMSMMDSFEVYQQSCAEK